MKKNVLTKYLAVFLLICIVLDGIMLCFFAEKPWWNNWMITGPNLFMILGAFYCHLMKKNVDEGSTKLTWLMVYKGIKMALIVTAAAYLVALAAETCVYNHYIKHLNQENKA